MTRLLIVDDDPFVRETLLHVLAHRRPEWDLVGADGGRAALDELERSPCDIIISDMRMPEMDGAELLKHVRDRYPGTIRFILTGYSRREDSLRAASAAHQFLLKPFGMAEFEATLERVTSVQALLSDPALIDAVGGVQSIPSPPRLYTELVSLLSDVDTSVDEVVGVLSQDPGMSAKVLQMSHTAFFGCTTDSVSVDVAVARLGFNVIKSMTLVAGVFSAFNGADDLAGFSIEAEQKHALLVASAARIIAGVGPEADEAFMVGILHDVGKTILAASRPELARRALVHAGEAGIHSVEAERKVLETTHAEIGGYLLGVWGLPYAVVEGVTNHHNPSRMAKEDSQIVAAVHIADALVREARQTSLGFDASSLIDMDFVRSLGAEHRLDEWRAVVESIVQ